MKMHRWFSMSLIVFLFCIAAISSSLAQESLPALVKKIEPSVVVILTYDEEGEVLGQGSGFFVSNKGDVITNRHVLQGASRSDVKTAKGKVYPIKRVLAEDKEGDLIRVSVDIPPNVVYPLSVSTSLSEAGERVIVIGSPLGLEKTVSDGIVSAVREIPEFGKIIQITAPISPGSSGSPVVNMKGEVIGVATFIVVEGQNLNFAIPGERVARLKPGKGQILAEWEAGREEEDLASAEGLYSTGLTFLWIEDYEKALPYFEDAIKKKPSYYEAYFLIGYCNHRLGRYQEAIAAYKQAIRIKPDLAEAHSILGVTYHKLGRYQEAIEAYKQAIRIKPDYAEAHFNLGVTYHELTRYQEAIEAFKQAIRIKPDDAEAHSNLGVTYGSLGRHQEEIEAFKQAIRIKPDYAEAHFNLGVTYLLLEDSGSALEEYKILKDLDRDLANKLFNVIYR